jgi:hypothetical protein
MQTVTTIGLDIAKSVFQVHGVDAGGQVVTRIDPDYPGFSPAKTDGIGRVELPRHGWLHIGWCWNVHQIELFTREETLVKQPKPSINYLTHLRQILVFLARPVSLGIGYFPPRLVYEFIKASVHAVIASALRSILWLVR